LAFLQIGLHPQSISWFVASKHSLQTPCCGQGSPRTNADSRSIDSLTHQWLAMILVKRISSAAANSSCWLAKTVVAETSLPAATVADEWDSMLNCLLVFQK
jgi:hypothetical protein